MISGECGDRIIRLVDLSELYWTRKLDTPIHYFPIMAVFTNINHTDHTPAHQSIFIRIINIHILLESQKTLCEINIFISPLKIISSGKAAACPLLSRLTITLRELTTITLLLFYSHKMLLYITKMMLGTIISSRYQEEDLQHLCFMLPEPCMFVSDKSSPLKPCRGDKVE